MRLTRICASSIGGLIERVGADKAGQKIMSKKAQILGFEIENLGFVALNILKQEAISVGADCATPRGAIKHEGEARGVLFGTRSQLERVALKLKIQPFGLKELGECLSTHLSACGGSRFGSCGSHLADSEPQIMAIVNATPDSFYEASRCDSKSAIERIYTLLEKGVGIIDLGAASSRPGSELLDSESEILRLKEICAEVKSQNLSAKATFSIDTYNPKTAEFALQSGFRIINDVSGLAHEDMLAVAGAHGAQMVLMHTKGTPKQMQNLTNTYNHLFGDIDEFFSRKIEALTRAGVAQKDIILDIGFGFAKDMEQNLALIRHLEHFKHFNLPLLVGASRKNTIGLLTGRDTSQRLSGTLALHLYALQNGASILRVHDEDEHIDMLKIHKALQC